MAVNNSLVAKKQNFGTYLTGDAVKNRINQIVGGKDGQRFITALTSAVTTNPALTECEPATILSAALLGESLKLSPSPQLANYYIVPFKDNKRGVTVAQFQLGYKGMIQLAIRSGQYKKLNVLAIKEGELINYNPLEEEIEVNLIDDEEKREQATTIGYFAMFEYLNGFRKTIYWSKAKMLNHADQYSQAFKKSVYEDLQAGKIPKSDLWKYSSPWYAKFDDMSFKTMLRQLLSKWGIMSIEMQDAYTKDMGVIQQDGAVEYVDNELLEEIKPETVIEEHPEATKKASRRSAEPEPKEEAVDLVLEVEEAEFEPSEDDFEKIFGDN